jgi:hypothetical protein
MRFTKLKTTSPFETEFREMTKPRYGCRGRLFAKHVRIEISTVNSEEIRLNWIYVEEGRRHRGYATDAVRWLCELADAHKIKIALNPLGDPDDNAMNTMQLTAWYQKFDFVRIGLQDEMQRLPNVTRA